MANTTSTRIIWINALERMCFENTVYLPTFPATDMSLRDLEYATLSPVSCELMARSGMLSARASHTIDISSIQPIVDSLPDSPSGSYLIPGGRYLILLQHNRLTLWDLGHVSGSTFHMKDGSCQLVASVVTNCVSFTAHPSPDGLTIRIATCHFHFYSFLYP